MKNFIAYIKSHPILWLLLLLFAFLAHGSMLLTDTVGIDTEALIDGREQNFLLIGRQGLYLIKQLLGNGLFNPYYAGALSIIFLFLSAMVWSYLYISAADATDGTHAVLPAAMFSLVLLSSSIITLQLYFKLQALEMTFGFLLLGAELCLMFYSMESTDRVIGRLWLLAVLPNLIIFSIYQIFYVLFIFAVASYILVRCFFSKATDNASAKQLFTLIFKSAAVFAVSAVLNQIISNAFFMEGGSYLANQMFWGRQTVAESLRQIVKHVAYGLLGMRGYYSAALLVFDIMLLIAVIMLLRRSADRLYSLLVILCALGVYASPFIMTVVTAHIPVVRSQLAMPFALAFSGLLLSLIYAKKGAVTPPMRSSSCAVPTA